MNTRTETTKRAEKTVPMKNAKKAEKVGPMKNAKKAEKAAPAKNANTAGKGGQAKNAELVLRRGGDERGQAKEKAKKARRAGGGEGGADGEAAELASRREAELAFARRRHEIKAMRPAAELRRVTVAIPAAVTIGLGAVPNIEAMMAEIRKELPNYDHERAGRLREYALAAAHAHYRVALEAEGEARLRALLEEAAPLRERMLRAAELHAHYGELDPDVVASIRRGTGHLDTANDLGQLAPLFRRAGDKLAGRTPVTEADIERAAALSDELLEALGQRRVGTDGASLPSEAEEDRIKAFWLYHGVYEESRRATAYVRWYEGDADQLVPSLFQGHRRRGSAPDEPVEEPAPAEPVDPAEGD
ncbi:MAG TPA: hypothetical protein VFS43_25265 [Polyangiaceae bacterium]|nr:hypothetical protein [Polyangiaceae bacterium]